MPISESDISRAAHACAAVKAEIQKVIIGQERLIERLLVAILSDGHILLEGVPGLAKTKVLTALTKSVHGEMNRIQFTPDLLPSDLVGTEVYRPQSGDFVIRKGPIFTNLLLADEINRAPAKVQSALLQAMQEREVTIGETTFKLPDPFLVLATQNPIEQEGTYPLPEAQVDRFLMKVKVSYPSREEELRMLQHGSGSAAGLSAVLSLPDLRTLRAQAAEVFVDPKIDRYIVDLVYATRESKLFKLDGLIEWGASPRASLALKACAKSLTLLRGRSFVTPELVQELAPEVLRHRILTTFEADAKGVSSDEIISLLLKNITVP